MGAGVEHRLRERRGLRPEALHAAVDLRGVDADQPDAAEPDEPHGVAVDDALDAGSCGIVEAGKRATTGAGNEVGNDEDGCDEPGEGAATDPHTALRGEGTPTRPRRLVIRAQAVPAIDLD